jgi:hypothetical protein
VPFEIENAVKGLAATPDPAQFCIMELRFMPLFTVDSGDHTVVAIGKSPDADVCELAMVEFQQRYVNSHRIVYNILSLNGLGNSAAPEIVSLKRADHWGISHMSNALAQKRLGKLHVVFRALAHT